MKVRFSGADRPGVEAHGMDALRLGQSYTVLEISTLADRPSFFRIEPIVGEAPALYDVRLFEVVSSALPNNWVATLQEGLLTIGPEVWRTPGFWEAYLDREPWAVKAYDAEREKLLSNSDE